MQFSAVLNIFIVKTLLNSTFTNDLKRKEIFSENVHSYRVCSFKCLFSLTILGGQRVVVGSFLMDEDPMRLEWNEIGIQWKGQLCFLDYKKLMMK